MPQHFTDLLKQMTGSPVPLQSGTADIASAMSLILDVLQKVVEGDRPVEYVPAIRATLVGLQKETASACAKMADEVDDLSGIGLSIRRRFELD